MAKPKRKVGMCPVMIACDGGDLYHGRKLCVKCEETLRKREKAQARA